VCFATAGKKLDGTNQGVSLMKPAIIIDKNFLQGTKKEKIQKLCNSHTLIMSFALFYELLTTDEKARKNCFSKLPAVVNPVRLIDHIGTLLQLEAAFGQPCGLPSQHCLLLDFSFNKQLKENKCYILCKYQKIIKEVEEDIEININSFVDLSETIPDLIPDTVQNNLDDLKNKAQKLIAKPEAVLKFYRALHSHEQKISFPEISGEPTDWAHIRWLQVQMLFATDMYIRYQGQLRNMLLKNKVRTKVEHDVHDAQILALAILEGAIATKENKLIKWFKLLRPNGTIHPDVYPNEKQAG
jgi:hypothetical protein